MREIDKYTKELNRSFENESDDDQWGETEENYILIISTLIILALIITIMFGVKLLEGNIPYYKDIVSIVSIVIGMYLGYKLNWRIL